MNIPSLPKARKKFAQHWLRDQSVLDQIVASAELKNGEPGGDRVLEIGPGTGILTTRLLSLANQVIAVEIDHDCCLQLQRRWSTVPNFLLLEADFLTLNLDQVFIDFPLFQRPNKVVANIPYNITGPILENLLGTISRPNPHPFEGIVLLIQQEVAQRLCAQPGSRTFGALTVRVQYLAHCQLIAHVPAKAFQPRPKVDSAIVRLAPRPFPNPANHPIFIERLIKLGFSSKRKMLRNNLEQLLDRNHLMEVLDDLHINPQCRAEDISVDQWVRLSNQLGEQYSPHPINPHTKLFKNP